MLAKENLLAIDCKHVLRAVSVLTSGSFSLYNYNFTIVSVLSLISTYENSARISYFSARMT